MSKQKPDPMKVIEGVFNSYAIDHLFPHFKTRSKKEQETLFVIVQQIEDAYYNIADFSKETMSIEFIYYFFEALSKSSKDVCANLNKLGEELIKKEEAKTTSNVYPFPAKIQ